eukprot:306118_1
MEFDIIFNINTDSTNNTQQICEDIDSYFGTLNNTADTLNGIDLIIYTLLLIQHTPSIKRIMSLPQTQLLSSQAYLTCSYIMHNDHDTSLLTQFTVKSVLENKNEIQTLFVSDSLFYNKTILLLNEYFGDSIIIIPTRPSNIVVPENMEIFNELYYFMLPVFVVLLLLVIFGCIHQKCSSKKCSKNSGLYREPYHSVDEFKITKIFSFGLQILDVYTDIIFIYEILIRKLNLINTLISSASIIFIAIPYIINIVLLFKIKDDVKLNPFVRDWMITANSKILAFLLIVCGSVYHTIGFSSSKLFGLNQFSAPLHFGDSFILLSYKFKYVILIEAMPQIVIQTAWLLLFNDENVYGKKMTIITFLSIALSVINLSTSSLEYLLRCKIYDDTKNKIQRFNVIFTVHNGKTNTTNDIQKIKFKQLHHLSLKAILCRHFGSDFKHCDLMKVKYDDLNDLLLIHGVVLKSADYQQLSFSPSISNQQSISTPRNNQSLISEVTAFYDLSANILSLENIEINDSTYYSNIIEQQQDNLEDNIDVVQITQSQSNITKNEDDHLTEHTTLIQKNSAAVELVSRDQNDNEDPKDDSSGTESN